MGNDPDSDGLTADDELDAKQLAAMDSLWRSVQQGLVTVAKAQEIEAVIRRGRVHGARKRLTQARRSRRAAPE